MKPLLFTDLLGQLIAQPSISSANSALDVSNRSVIDLLANCLQELGFSIEIQELPGDKANLIATLGSGPHGLVLAGHTDTVPCDAPLWASDPFTLTDRDQRFYGLGTTDMKGFFAVAIEAIKELDLQTLRQPLIILATADEESSMAGARALTQAKTLRARYAIVGEPTNLKPVRMHKGVMMESVRLQGQSGHSSNPALGRSALDAMHLVITELMQLRQQWGKRYQNPAFNVAVPTLNLASIHGGDAPNRICQHCELRFDVRLLPGMQNDEVRHSVQQVIDRSLEGSGVTASCESLFAGVEAFIEPAEHELIQTVERLTGHSSGSANFATEAPFLQSLGMQTVVLGPGSIDCAHQANEYLAHDQIKPAIELLKNLIGTYCIN
ncbi:MAG: acetylornithine deacetylase [Pseudomonadales bacterium]|nr:acetylornithine deacetylase [Pseudomonadales bacterium]MDG2078958.1 acetylornithine deacetylase [Pseudomonadales bacterium]